MAGDGFLAHELERLDEAGLRRHLRVVEEAQDARLLVGGKSVISLCSNNYLGLANHPALAEAAARAARDLGVGAGASRLVSGSMRIHAELEEQLASFKGVEAALLFNSGYHANLGVIAAAVGAEDAVFSDELNHASLIDGCRLSRARVCIYRHADVSSLEELLRGTKARRRLIVTDSIFSMEGDAAPLREICDLAERYGCMVMVDEAHATGVVGPNGGGLAEELGVQQRVTIQMGTLGKALGCFGAYVAGSRRLVDFLINTARTLIFTTALPPPVVAAASVALDIVGKEPERREAVRRNALRLRTGLRDCGYEIGRAETHIVPVIIGDPNATMRLSDFLFDHGVLAQGIRPPTVPPGTSRIRATVMATHSDRDIDAAISAFREAALQEEDDRLLSGASS